MAHAGIIFHGLGWYRNPVVPIKEKMFKTKTKDNRFRQQCASNYVLTVWERPFPVTKWQSQVHKEKHSKFYADDCPISPEITLILDVSAPQDLRPRRPVLTLSGNAAIRVPFM